jgi:hypothetical protein
MLAFYGMERVNIIEGSPVGVKDMRTIIGIVDFNRLPNRKDSSERVDSGGLSEPLEITPTVSPSVKCLAMNQE